jgi:hypothetical protein
VDRLGEFSMLASLRTYNTTGSKARDLRTVIVDVTALGNDSSVTQLTLRSDTDLTKGAQPMTLSAAQTLAQELRYRFPAHCSPESEARLSSIIDECC